MENADFSDAPPIVGMFVYVNGNDSESRSLSSKSPEKDPVVGLTKFWQVHIHPGEIY